MKKVFIMLFLVFISNSVFSQTDSTEREKNLLLKQPVGNEFWLTFMQNFKDDESKAPLNLELFLTGDMDANVVIEIVAIKYKKKVFVPAGTVISELVSFLAQIKSSETIENGLAVHVTSDNPISVYGLNRRHQTTDTYLGLPTNVLGKEYRAMCYHVTEDFLPIFAIVATEDNTVVTITPTSETYAGKEKNVPFDVTMNKGDVYQVKPSVRRRSNKRESDLTGSLITANKNISVFSGHQCSYVPIGPPTVIACNHLAEQMPPISSWGKHFYLGKLKGRSQYTYRVLANENDTKVFENSTLLKILKEGEYLERNSNQNLQLTADRPVLVAQYSQGFDNGDSIGDPMMLLITPTQQFLKQYRFATPINGSWNHYINVVIPTNSINSITLNSRKLDPKIFEPLGISRYSIAFIPIPFGTHFIKADEPFGMYSYGFGFGQIDSYDAYGNMGGQSFIDYVAIPDTLKPTVEYKLINNKNTLILRDDRTEDTGLQSIYIVDSLGILPRISPISPGIPQATIELLPKNTDEPSYLKIEASDVSGNITQFMVCYHLHESGNFVYTLSDGYEAKCIETSGLQLGAFLKSSINFHNADFSNSGNINAPGKFSSSSGQGGYFGLVVAYPISHKWILSARASIDSYNGTLVAPDSIISKYLDTTTGQYMPFSESHSLKLLGTYFDLGFAGEYYFVKYLYGLAGFNLSMKLTSTIAFTKEIVIPEGFIYKDGNRTHTLPQTELNSLTSINLGYFVGIGITYPIYNKFHGYLESTYNQQFGSLIDDGNWNFSRITLMIGLRYKL